MEAKLVVGEGAGHGVWKVIEGERARWEADRRRGEEEALREPLDTCAGQKLIVKRYTRLDLSSDIDNMYTLLAARSDTMICITSRSYVGTTKTPACP